jgi:hypothetical protein
VAAAVVAGGGRRSVAAVADGQPHPPGTDADRHLDAAPRRARLERVAQQVTDRAAERPPVGEDRRRRQLAAPGEPPRLRFEVERGERLAGHLGEVGRQAWRRLRARQVEKAAQRSFEPRRLVADALDQTALGGAAVSGERR